MMSRTEDDNRVQAERQLCRFLNGDLPLFAFQHWLDETENPLPGPLRLALLALAWERPDIRDQIEQHLQDYLPADQAQLWLLREILPWIVNNDARATRAVALCWQLQNQGLPFLAAVGQALASGFSAESGQVSQHLSPWDAQANFDWERIKILIPDLQPAAGLLLDLLTQHPQPVAPTPAQLEREPASWLLYEDWQKANQAIAQWQASHTNQPGLILHKEPGLLLEQALKAANQQHWNEAETLLLQVLQTSGEHAGAYHLLGLIYQAQGQTDKTVPCFEKALELGASREILPQLARLQHDQGHLFAAGHAYSAALQAGLQLEDQDLHRYGHCLRDSGQPAEALRIYRHLLRLYPNHDALWMHLGHALFDLAQFHDAEDAYLHCLKLAPENALAHFSLARLQAYQGQTHAAEKSLHDSLKLDPNLVPAWNLMGSLAQGRGALTQALNAFQAALERQPEDPASLNNLGSCYQALYQGEAAEEAYTTALRLDPKMPEARLNLANLQRERNCPEMAQNILAPLLARYPDLQYIQALTLPIVAINSSAPSFWLNKLSHSLRELEARPVPLADPLRQVGRVPFYAPYLGDSDLALQSQMARVFLKACPGLHWQASPEKQIRPTGPWRVGVVSGFFYDHTVWHLFGYLLKGLKETGLHVTACYTGHKEDHVTALARASANHFVTLPHDLDRARSLIAEQQLDLLLYLDVSMDPLSYFLGFSRLAPIQCATWGHGVTTGLPEMDYFLSCKSMEFPAGSDPTTPPEASSGQYSENCLLLPGFFGHWQSQEPSETHPGDFGLPPGKYYLCPHSLYKFHPDFDSILAGILNQDSDAVLVLIEGLYPEWQEHLMSRWKEQFNTDRICWLKRMSSEDYLRLLSLGDVLLDTRPFGSGLTLLQALSLGVPVVTWPTEILKGRIGYAICSELGWFEGVADSETDYIERAIRLAGHWNANARLELKQHFKAKILPEKMAGMVSQALQALCVQKFNVQP